ncbi:h aca ribonucleoprotein complex non-core subunit naf1 [Lasius niger]|uniref:H/ACA ribonucleoprotein complex non-core subunit NAF1 n=1 Tax=Lasius niger TaxID=67767 RepID=A0A0J7L2Y8_LASNI|nr:h aca ribonucleoprotein complex non-core subunit naf1 [Lasius niger]
MPSAFEPSSKPLMTVPDAKHENGKVSSLNVIALEYDNSNSDVEEVEVDTNKTEDQNAVTIPEKQTLQQYRTIEENVLSSCEEIDSEDDSSSSSNSSSSSSTNSDDSSNSDNDSDDNTSANNNKKKKGNTAGTAKKKKQTENEFDDLPPIEDLKISVPEVLCDLLGEIDKIVEQLVIIKPKPGKPTLHVDTVLFMEKGERALGKILDVFGPVSEPNYCIRFNNFEHIQNSNIKVGMSVYYCPNNTQYTSLIFLHELHKMKSYDAVGDDEPVFSDDEEERAYYETLKQKNSKDSSDGSVSRKRQRTSSLTQNRPTEWQSTHPWNRNAQFQRYNQERQQALRNNGHFNLSQYGQYSYNDSWLQYQYQSNMHWPPVPRNMHPMFNRPNAEYGPSFNESCLPQYGNYNSNSSGATPNSQCNNMQPQYPRIPFGAPPRFNPTFPSFPMNYPQLPNASFSYIDMSSYPISARPPMHTNALCSSLPPPPPPSIDSKTID